MRQIELLLNLIIASATQNGMYGRLLQRMPLCTSILLSKRLFYLHGATPFDAVTCQEVARILDTRQLVECAVSTTDSGVTPPACWHTNLVIVDVTTRHIMWQCLCYHFSELADHSTSMYRARPVDIHCIRVTRCTLVYPRIT